MSVRPGANVIFERLASFVHGVQCPVSKEALMISVPAPHGERFLGLAVEYSGWKLNGVPLQSVMLVFMKPLAADACMKPLWPVVRSSTTAISALPPPGAGAS